MDCLKYRAGLPKAWMKGGMSCEESIGDRLRLSRFIDANNKDIPNYTANPANIGDNTTPTLDSFLSLACH